MGCNIYEIFAKDGVTLYDIYETLSGPLEWAIRDCLGGIGDFNSGMELKEFVEGQGEDYK